MFSSTTCFSVSFSAFLSAGQILMLLTELIETLEEGIDLLLWEHPMISVCRQLYAS
jgi:hypothetical protein